MPQKGQNEATLTISAENSCFFKPTSYQVRRVFEAIKMVDMQMFLELEKIRKPSAAVLSIAKMSCLFFEILAQSEPSEMYKVENLVTWT